MDEVITVSFPAKPVHVRLARVLVRNFLLYKSVADKDIFDTELAIDEAIANVITHTYDNDPTKYVLMTLKWEYATTKLSVLIRDFGPSVNPAVLKPRPIQEHSTSGFGLHIIHKVFDCVSLKNLVNGNLLTMTKTYRLSSYERKENS